MMSVDWLTAQLRETQERIVAGMTPERAAQILQSADEVLGQCDYYALACQVSLVREWLQKQAKGVQE